MRPRHPKIITQQQAERIRIDIFKKIEWYISQVAGSDRVRNPIAYAIGATAKKMPYDKSFIARTYRRGRNVPAEAPPGYVLEELPPPKPEKVQGMFDFDETIDRIAGMITEDPDVPSQS